jgi:hypothetical protein
MIFNAWNAEVQRTVPADRLLVFDVKDGWELLCHFLGMPVPDTPFPHSNAGEGFQQNMSKRFFSRLFKKAD